MNTQFKKGHIPWSKGKKVPHSENTKNKISISRKGKCLGNQHAKGHTPWNKGKKCPGIGGRPFGGTSWTKGKIGKEHPRWKENKAQSLKCQIRQTFEYRQWRSDVFQRDNYTCIFCGDNKGHNLEVDHIIPFSDILQKNNIITLDQAISCEELWNINNGRTLCNPCHRKTETYAPNLKHYNPKDNIKEGGQNI